jgi:hypothetical protein
LKYDSFDLRFVTSIASKRRIGTDKIKMYSTESRTRRPLIYNGLKHATALYTSQESHPIETKKGIEFGWREGPTGLNRVRVRHVRAHNRVRGAVRSTFLNPFLSECLFCCFLSDQGDSCVIFCDGTWGVWMIRGFVGVNCAPSDLHSRRLRPSERDSGILVSFSNPSR